MSATTKSVAVLEAMSTSLPFEKIKHIHSKYKFTVTGYIRNVKISEIPESIILVILLFYYNTIESSILTDDECHKLLSLFETENVFKNLGNYSFKLLFQGTRDKFKSKTFFENCNKKHTLCIIHTPQNNVFGGYTSLPWQTTNGSVKYETDSSAFVYSIRLNKQVNPKIFRVKKNGLSAIAQCRDSYLIFGHYGFAFNFYQSGNSKVTGYASATDCPEYNLNAYELNGKKHTFSPIEIEVFQLE